MAEVALARPYAPENFAKALDNLTKRYDDQETEVHYSNAAFDGLSEDQAADALRFFGEIGLIEIPKQGYYSPPQHVITWQRSIEGPAKTEAKRATAEKLEDYEVFREVKFLLENSSEEKDLTALAREVGGKIGIDEDDVSRMERTIEVLAECKFLDIGEDHIVSLSEDVNSSSESEKSSPEPLVEEIEGEKSADDGGDDDGGYDSSIQSSESEERAGLPPNVVGGITADLSISLDATEMEVDDLRKKLKIINETISNDGA